MPIVPAFCEVCGTAFPSGLAAENSSISIANFTCGPCPRCGGLGRVPDGLYNIVGNSVEILANSKRSVSDLERIAQLLRDAKRRSATPEEIALTIKKELPELAAFTDTIPKTRPELYAFVAIILTIIGMLINSFAKKESPRIEIHQVINNVAEQPLENMPIGRQPTPIRNKKIGRNEPCPCGSNRKYKKCCGR